MRFQDGMNDFKPDPMPPHQRVWIRAVDKMPDDVRLHQCVLAYASDMTLMDNAIRPHGIGWTEENFQTASLDHAMWFHQPFRADEWLLYYQDSPYSGAREALTGGSFFYSRRTTYCISIPRRGLCACILPAVGEAGTMTCPVEYMERTRIYYRAQGFEKRLCLGALRRFAISSTGKTPERE